MNRAINHLLVAMLLLVGCHSGSQTPPLAGTAMGGPFALTDENGQPFSDTRLIGQYRLVYFGYSFCPDVCPADMSHVMRGFSELESRNPILAAQIQPLFITIDPKRDTPQVLVQFTNAFHPRLIGLTGTAVQIADVAKRYGVFYETEAGDAHQNYRVNHNRMTVLYGKSGEPLALLDEDGAPAKIADELEQWAR
jgi:protein SCO1/2